LLVTTAPSAVIAPEAVIESVPEPAIVSVPGVAVVLPRVTAPEMIVRSLSGVVLPTEPAGRNRRSPWS
jgi:hypothetical protein